MKTESQLKDIKKENKCQACGANDAERYRQNTLFTDEEKNWVKLCPDCRKENDAYWKERWDDYYRERQWLMEIKNENQK